MLVASHRTRRWIDSSVAMSGASGLSVTPACCTASVSHGEPRGLIGRHLDGAPVLTARAGNPLPELRLVAHPPAHGLCAKALHGVARPAARALQLDGGRRL